MLHCRAEIFQAAFDRIAGIGRTTTFHRLVRLLEIPHHAVAIARILHVLTEIRITRSYNNVDRPLCMGLVPSDAGLVRGDGQVGIVECDLQLVMGLQEKLMR